MTASSNVPSVLSLNKGSGTSMRVREGDVLHVNEGSIAISGVPQWLGEQLIQSEQVYRRGATYVAPVSGCVRLSAYEAGCVVELRIKSSKQNKTITKTAGGAFWRFFHYGQNKLKSVDGK